MLRKNRPPQTLFFTQSAEKTVPKRKIIGSAIAVPNRIETGAILFGTQFAQRFHRFISAKKYLKKSEN